jgi:hypothetical protein
MTAAEASARPARGGKPLPTVKLAYRDLFDDCLRLILTPVAMVFSVLAMAVQFGLRLGSENPTATLSGHAQWAMPFGPQSFDAASLLPGHEKHAILSRLGVADMEELAVGFVAWRKLSGGATAGLLVGSDARNNRSLPRDIIAGSLMELTSPDAVSIDGTYSRELGILQRGNRAEANNEQVTMGILLGVLAISRARFHAVERHDDQFGAVAAGIQHRYGVFAAISAIKGLASTRRSCSAGGGRQGHATNPGS